MPTADLTFNLLDSTDSTNNYAMGKAYAGLASHGEAYFTSCQTQGKGQRGRTWSSNPGENIALSIVLIPKYLDISQQFQLSAAVALACYRFIKKYAGDETSIKWPNDIYWRDRKAAGILIENALGSLETGKTGWKFSVVGIGINVNQTNFDPSIPNPVSLKQITGKDFNPEELAKELQAEVLSFCKQCYPEQFINTLAQYNAALYKRNALVRLKKAGIVFETTIKEVTETGCLHTSDIIDNYFQFGEIEWFLNDSEN
jgi:BirA family biotin operon repressor/biotin-[acetyl-CoA-carboxylase] ligase